MLSMADFLSFNHLSSWFFKLPKPIFCSFFLMIYILICGDSSDINQEWVFSDQNDADDNADQC